MFPNKNSVATFSKLSKYKFESRSEAFFGLLERRPLPRLNQPKMSVLSLALESNGFRGGFSPAIKLPKMLGSGRVMSQDSRSRCWNCKKTLEMKDFSCSSCNALQYPQQNVNFFHLFGISQMYEINFDDLSRKFRNLQMIFHPDKFVNKSKEEQEISEAYSRLLNKAYKTLKDPVGRGLYLLELQNASKDTQPLQQEFLMRMMEKNEELEAIDTLPALSTFMKSNDAEIEEQIKQIKEAFRASELESAKANLHKLNYLMNLDAKIKEKQSTFTQPTET